MAQRARVFDAVQTGDIEYLQNLTYNTFSYSQINRALRLACSFHQPEIAALLVQKGADDFEGGLIAACRVNDVFMMEKMLTYFSNSTPNDSVIHHAFIAACEQNSTSTAEELLSFHAIIWDGLVPYCETAARLLKSYFLSGEYVTLMFNEYWATKILELMQPHEYYNLHTLHIRLYYPDMAETVIAHRLDRFYRFKSYLSFYLPIPDLVLLCCSYF